jgi:histidinol dehydrogenase
MIPIVRLPDRGTQAYERLVSRRPLSDETRLNTQKLLADVRLRGDAAVADATERFDGVRLEHTLVPPAELAAALRNLDPDLRQALLQASERIAKVHRAQRFREEPVETVPGVRVWREWRPLRRVGIYVPGGRTVYPSSVLMLAVPARIAGCAEVVLCSPPQKDGRVAPAILAAAAIAEVTEVHAIGGAQAIAAMAYGTGVVARVDKIFGPGNEYVTAAKLLVFGEVAIDMPAGPSEIVVVADGSTPAAWVAADLKAQAEHAPDAVALLVTPDREFATEVAGLLQSGLESQVRLLLSAEIGSAVDFADAFAPEHLSLACAEPERWLSRISQAGSVFLGANAPAAAGDYATGANHVLPTGGSARAFSALGLEAFGRVMQVQAIEPAGLKELQPIVDRIALAEGLSAHAESVRSRTHAGIA